MSGGPLYIHLDDPPLLRASPWAFVNLTRTSFQHRGALELLVESHEARSRGKGRLVIALESSSCSLGGTVPCLHESLRGFIGVVEGTVFSIGMYRLAHHKGRAIVAVEMINAVFDGDFARTLRLILLLLACLLLMMIQIV